MEKDTKNSAIKREELIGEDIIPVATVSEEAASSLLPKKKKTDELVVVYRKPYDFEGEIHKELDLHGLEDMKGRDLTAIEKSFNKTGVNTTVPETTATFAKIVATKVTGLPAEYFEDLPAGEVEKIKNAVVGFLYKDE